MIRSSCSVGVITMKPVSTPSYIIIWNDSEQHPVLLSQQNTSNTPCHSASADEGVRTVLEFFTPDRGSWNFTRILYESRVQVHIDTAGEEPTVTPIRAKEDPTAS